MSNPDNPFNDLGVNIALRDAGYKGTQWSGCSNNSDWVRGQEQAARDRKIVQDAYGLNKPKESSSAFENVGGDAAWPLILIIFPHVIPFVALYFVVKWAVKQRKKEQQEALAAQNKAKARAQREGKEAFAKHLACKKKVENDKIGEQRYYWGKNGGLTDIVGFEGGSFDVYVENPYFWDEGQCHVWPLFAGVNNTSDKPIDIKSITVSTVKSRYKNEGPSFEEVETKYVFTPQDEDGTIVAAGALRRVYLEGVWPQSDLCLVDLKEKCVPVAINYTTQELDGSWSSVKAEVIDRVVKVVPKNDLNQENTASVDEGETGQSKSVVSDVCEQTEDVILLVDPIEESEKTRSQKPVVSDSARVKAIRKAGQGNKGPNNGSNGSGPSLG